MARRGPGKAGAGRALSETAVSGAGDRAGTAGRIQVRRERLRGALSARLGLVAPSSPFPAAALRGEPGGGRARTEQIREIEGSSLSSFAPEARPGVWTRFVKRPGFEGPRGFRSLGKSSSTSRFFTSRRVAESRLEAPWTTWKGRWRVGGEWD